MHSVNVTQEAVADLDREVQNLASEFDRLQTENSQLRAGNVAELEEAVQQSAIEHDLLVEDRRRLLDACKAAVVELRCQQYGHADRVSAGHAAVKLEMVLAKVEGR